MAPLITEAGDALVLVRDEGWSCARLLLGGCSGLSRINVSVSRCRTPGCLGGPEAADRVLGRSDPLLPSLCNLTARACLFPVFRFRTWRARISSNGATVSDTPVIATVLTAAISGTRRCLTVSIYTGNQVPLRRSFWPQSPPLSCVVMALCGVFGARAPLAVSCGLLS